MNEERKEIMMSNYYLVDIYKRRYNYLEWKLDVEDIVMNSYLKTIEKYIVCDNKYTFSMMMYYEVRHNIYLENKKELREEREEIEIGGYEDEEIYYMELMEKYGVFERLVIRLYLDGYTRKEIVDRVGIGKYKINILINIFLCDIGAKYSDSSMKQSGIDIDKLRYKGEIFDSFDELVIYLVENNFFKGEK